MAAPETVSETLSKRRVEAELKRYAGVRPAHRPLSNAPKESIPDTVFCQADFVITRKTVRDAIGWSEWQVTITDFKEAHDRFHLRSRGQLNVHKSISYEN
jgi:hypothetical protein